jgi:hypothetical protein
MRESNHGAETDIEILGLSSSHFDIQDMVCPVRMPVAIAFLFDVLPYDELAS